MDKNIVLIDGLPALAFGHCALKKWTPKVALTLKWQNSRPGHRHRLFPALERIRTSKLVLISNFLGAIFTFTYSSMNFSKYDWLFQRITNDRERALWLQKHNPPLCHFLKICLYYDVLYGECTCTRCLCTLFYTSFWRFNSQWTNTNQIQFLKCQKKTISHQCPSRMYSYVNRKKKIVFYMDIFNICVGLLG